MKTITCIECPKGCKITIDKKDDGTLQIEGFDCPKGEQYAIEETNSPVRILTSTVKCSNLSLARVPVRTSLAIPKERLSEAMTVIHSTSVDKPLLCGDIIIKDFLELTDIDLIATRTVKK